MKHVAFDNWLTANAEQIARRFNAEFSPWQRTQVRAWLSRLEGEKKNPALAARIYCRFGSTIRKMMVYGNTGLIERT
jgi:hypothetical protein